MARDDLDQGLEHRLCLGVDPVEILEEHGDWLETTLLEEQQLNRLQRPPLPLGGIERLPLRIVERHVEEREDGGERWRQRTVERQHLFRHSLPDLASVVARLDLEVSFQQLDDWEIGCCLPVGGRAADKDQRVPGAVRLDELPEETRLADAGLADDSYDLTVALADMLERQGQLLQLTVPGDERRELLAQPQRSSSEARKPVSPSSCSIFGREGRDDKTSLQERARRLAHEHGPRLGTPHEGLELHPRLAFGIVVDPRRTVDSGDQDLAGVETDADVEEFR